MIAGRDSQCLNELGCRYPLISGEGFERKLSALFCGAGACLVRVARDRPLVAVGREEFEF
jgi:hypothetical protein